MDTSEAGSEYLRQCIPPTAEFHRVGLGIAATIVATGLAFIGAAVIRLELLEFLRADIFSIVLGLTFVLLGVIAISAYGVVRAIEWFSRSCPDEWWQAREVR